MIHREMNKSNGFLILYLIPSKTVSPLFSEHLRVVEVLPDYTLGGFFGALYYTGHNSKDPLFNAFQDTSGKDPVSLLEFGIITALTQYDKKKGFYLSPDTPVRGPELLWETSGNGLSLCGRDDSHPCISLNVNPITPKIPLKLYLPLIEMRGEGAIFNRTLPITNVAISYSSIHIPPSSPLSDLPFKSKIFSLIFSLNQVATAKPDTIKRKVFKELKTGVYG